jgi:hypothetical protein
MMGRRHGVIDIPGCGEDTKAFGAVIATVVSYEDCGCAMSGKDWFHSFD